MKTRHIPSLSRFPSHRLGKSTQTPTLRIATFASATLPNRMRIALWSWSIQSRTCHEPIRLTLSNVFSLLARRPTPKMPPVTEKVTTALGTSGASVMRMTACAPFRRPARSRHAEQAEQELQGSKRKAPVVPYLYGALAVQLAGFLG